MKLKRRSTLLKAIFVVFLAPLSSTAMHSLQYLTAVTAGTNFTIALVDGQQFLYYSSSNNQMTVAEWMKDFHRPNSWEAEIQSFSGEQSDLHHHLTEVVKLLNHTAGDHTMQWLYGCEIADDGTNKSYNNYSVDGTDFLHLNTLNLNWTAANEKAEIFKNNWDMKGKEAQHMIHYLKTKCIDRLTEYVSHLNTSQKKVSPEASVFQKHSPSPEVVCHATGFFPKAVNITWRKDGEDVHEDVELRETLPNQDGSFQKRSILKVPAEDLQKHTYTCVIQHSSLEKELVLTVKESREIDGWTIIIIIIIIAVVLFALLVGIVFVWKKKKSSGAEQPHEDQQNGTEMHPLNSPHNEVTV